MLNLCNINYRSSLYFVYSGKNTPLCMFIKERCKIHSVLFFAHSAQHAPLVNQFVFLCHKLVISSLHMVWYINQAHGNSCHRLIFTVGKVSLRKFKNREKILIRKKKFGLIQQVTLFLYSFYLSSLSLCPLQD